jgi:hypothetical protein
VLGQILEGDFVGNLGIGQRRLYTANHRGPYDSAHRLLDNWAIAAVTRTDRSFRAEKVPANQKHEVSEGIGCSASGSVWLLWSYDMALVVQQTDFPRVGYRVKGV